MFFALLAQLVEHATFNRGVGGSNPPQGFFMKVEGSWDRNPPSLSCFCEVDQRLDRQPHKMFIWRCSLEVKRPIKKVSATEPG